jgi:cytochrome c oxidase subunit 2
VLATSAFASNGGLGPVSPVSPNGHKSSSAYWLVFALTTVIFVGVESALIFFIVRFRSRGRARTEDGPDIHGSTKLETAWTIFPVVLLAIIATFVFVNLPGFVHPASADKKGALHVHVIAHQFYWEFRYPGGAVAYDQMVAPAGRLVLLDIDSQDVAHSWWIPAFGPKSDAIPGQTNHAWFKVAADPDNPERVFKGSCSELCGLLHAKMTQSVKIVAPAAYAAWLQKQSNLTPVQLGKQEFDAVCSKCHGVEAEGFIGPKLSDNPITLDPKQLGPIVRNGRGKMPAVGAGWSQDQIDALVAYFKTQPFGGSSGQ